MSDLEEFKETVALITELRTGEGAAVQITCDNPEPDSLSDQCQIGVSDSWTNWDWRFFRAPTVLEALRMAARARKESHVT